MYTAKKAALALLCCLLAAACGKSKEARAHLDEAKHLYETEQYAAAKTAIDSIRANYPREVDVLKEALTLMRLVERGESLRNIAFCDSMLPIRTSQADSLKAAFVFEKDAAYQDVGNYVWKQQSVERNLHRSYIRCGVDEQGVMYIASVYAGSRPLNHTGLKLAAADGTFAETPAIPYDGGVNYRFTDMGVVTEVVTYKGDHCQAVVQLICNAAQGTRIRAEYTGGSSFALTLTEADRKAICTTAELATALADIDAMQREKEKATKKIAYLDAKLNGEAPEAHTR